MKKLLIASIAGTVLMAVGSADAADLGPRPTYKAPPPIFAPAPIFAWTGCYVGGNIGGAWAHKSFSHIATADMVEQGFAIVANGGIIDDVVIRLAV